MPVQLPHSVTAMEIENAIHTWMTLLADENYEAAYMFTLHDPYYEWTPLLLEQVINGYGLPYANDGSPKCKVTDWSTASGTGSKRYKEINFFDTSRAHFNPQFIVTGDIYYDLPIDSVWSDLTATFKILQSKDFTTLELNEIHVM